jgi:phage protein U
MRIGRRPAEQFLGPGEEELRLHGIIFPHVFGGYDQLNDMRDTAEAGLPMGLADAKGIYHGPWCIRMILDEQEYFHPNGDPRRVEFDIELVAYGT